VGTLLAGRYRILGLAGRGGMGEVYRAEDIKLDQSVALKLLPEGLEDDRGRLERLYNEVRTARQVSHPAVCRVWDIGDVDRHHFLTMEYVDGENLSSLLRRIGRLPEDKAIEIAEQICAGLAAAHAKGVIHRDLKPANIMLDGQGKVRITDFGLAGLADSFRGSDLRSGTPAFMAPEQLQGREVTFRSDIYSLGLVLYELFTGRRAFEGRTEAELARKQRDENPIDPSAIVHDLPPAVERTILACIQKNPRRRPPSALAVAAMLRGRDPLEAAIAAGDTPSPELVAAAGEMERPGTRLAWAGLIVTVIGAVMAPALLAPFHVVSLVPPELPPAVLEHRAREILEQLGHTEHAADSAYELDVDDEYFDNVRRSESRPRNWSGLRSGHPAVARFWYRQSPRPLAARATSGRVRWRRPPVDISGMAGVTLDLKGRLLGFYSVPPQRESEAQPSPPPDWTPLLQATGLDPAQLEPAAPEWTPPFYAETRAAWLGHWPDRPEIPIRLEAAAHRGRLVWLQIVEPWTRPSRMQPYEPTRSQRLTGYLAVAILLLLVAVGAGLARYNLRLGRGDRRGAARLVILVLGLGLTNALFPMHHVAAIFDEIGLLGRATAMSVFMAMLLWLFYLALEPFVRRQRPRVLVSWNRLLGGGYRDAVVGRDVLIGAVWGVLAAGLYGLAGGLPERLGHTAPDPLESGLGLLLGLRPQVALVASLLMSAILMSLGSLLLYLVLRLALRRDAIASVALVLVLAALGLGSNIEPLWLWLAMRLFLMATYVFLLLRLGIVATIVGTAVGDLFLLSPLTLDLGAWYAQPTYIAVGLVGLLAFVAFRTTLGGVGARLRALSGDSHSRG
jgi:serine/threonine-protein kinase